MSDLLKTLVGDNPGLLLRMAELMGIASDKPEEIIKATDTIINKAMKPPPKPIERLVKEVERRKNGKP